MSTQVSGLPAGMLSPAAMLSSKGIAASAANSAPGIQAWSIVGVVGVGLAVIGWTDVATGLLPFSVGNPDWEFGAISTAIDSMPLATIGLGVAAAAAVAHSRRTALTFLSVFVGLVVLFLMAAIVLYGLSVPVIFKAVPPQMNAQVIVAVTKTSLLAVTYLVLYGFIARHVWRARKPGRA